MYKIFIIKITIKGARRGRSKFAFLFPYAFCLCNKIASIMRYIIQIAEAIRVKKNIVIASPVPQKLCGLIKAKEILMATIISPTKTNIR